MLARSSAQFCDSRDSMLSAAQTSRNATTILNENSCSVVATTEECVAATVMPLVAGGVGGSSSSSAATSGGGGSGSKLNPFRRRVLSTSVVGEYCVRAAAVAKRKRRLFTLDPRYT